MRRTSIIILLFLLGTSLIGRAGETIQLFDGRSLLGWYTEQHSDVSIEDGSIRLKAEEGVHLSYARGFTNFIFDAECMSPKGAYPGLAVRVSGLAGGAGLALGPDGLLRALEDLKADVDGEPVLLPGRWNTVRIICTDTLVQVFVNGRQTDRRELDSVTSGHPALFSSGDMVCRFQNITLTPLDGQPPSTQQPFALGQNARVAIIGGGHAERMQHHGWFESMLQLRFGGKDVVLRNLARSGNTLRRQLDKAAFDELKHDLEWMEADAVIVAFGFNESFSPHDRASLKTDLELLVQRLRGCVFNGREPPAVVMVSPAAVEPRGLFTSVKDRNAALDVVSGIMRGAAIQQKVTFADVFTPTLRAYAEKKTMTVDGCFFSGEGAREYAQILERALFRNLKSETVEVASLERLRESVVRKNSVFRQRRFPFNRHYLDQEVDTDALQAEMRELDQILLSSDRDIWALAQRGAIAGDVKNRAQQAQLEVPDATELLKSFTVDEDYEVQLFASEKQFQELANPTDLVCDSAGRLWVCVAPAHPMPYPGQAPAGKVLIFADTDKDGRADKVDVFADKLTMPMGLALGPKGLYVADAPHLVFFPFNDSNDHSGERHILLSGFGTEDIRQALHGLHYAADGALYFKEGHLIDSHVETSHGPVRSMGGGAYRFQPRDLRVSRVTYYTSVPGDPMAQTTLSSLLSSSLKTFRPMNAVKGLAGDIYVCDLANPVITTMRYDRYDHNAGRIWRLSRRDRENTQVEDVEGMPLKELLSFLSDDDGELRRRARMELHARPAAKVVPAIDDWIEELQVSHPRFDGHMLEALWLAQAFGKTRPGLVNHALKSSDPAVRAAAVDTIPWVIEHAALSSEQRRRLIQVFADDQNDQAGEALAIMLLAQGRRGHVNKRDDMLEVLVGLPYDQILVAQKNILIWHAEDPSWDAIVKRLEKALAAHADKGQSDSDLEKKSELEANEIDDN